MLFKQNKRKQWEINTTWNSAIFWQQYLIYIHNTQYVTESVRAWWQGACNIGICLTPMPGTGDSNLLETKLCWTEKGEEAGGSLPSGGLEILVGARSGTACGRG